MKSHSCWHFLLPDSGLLLLCSYDLFFSRLMFFPPTGTSKFDCFELPSHASTDPTLATKQKIESAGLIENIFALMEMLYVMATARSTARRGRQSARQVSMGAVCDVCQP